MTEIYCIFGLKIFLGTSDWVKDVYACPNDVFTVEPDGEIGVSNVALMFDKQRRINCFILHSATVYTNPAFIFHF